MTLIEDDLQNVYNLGSYLPIYKEYNYVHPVLVSDSLVTSSK